jgi:hypothetical protein
MPVSLVLNQIANRADFFSTRLVRTFLVPEHSEAIHLVSLNLSAW